LKAAKDLVKRSVDGRVVYSILPHEIQVIEIKEKREGHSEETVRVLSLRDGTTIKFSQSGEVVLVTAEDKQRMNQGELPVW